MKNLRFQHQRIIVTILLLILVIFVNASFFDYDYTNRKHSENSMREVAQKNNKTLNYTVKNKLNDMEITLTSFSLIAAQYDDIRNPDLLQLLANQSENSKFLRLAVTTADGLSHTSDGKTHDSSDRSYFKESMKGHTFVSEVLTSRVDHKRVITISVPIRKNNTIVGLLRNSIEVTSLEELLHMAPITKGVESMIVQSDGTIVTKTLKSKNVNYYATLETAKFEKGISLSKIKEAFKTGKSGMISYTMNNKERYSYYSPVPDSDWIIVTILPYQLITNQLSKNYQTTIYLTIKLFLALVVIIMFIIWNERKNIKRQANMNRKLDAIIDNTPGCMVRYEVNHPQNINFLNDALFYLSGYTKKEFDEILHHDIRMLIYQEDTKTLEEKIQHDLHSEQKTFSYSYRIQHKRGHLIWVMDHRHLVKDSNQILWFYITLIDITETKLIQEKLRISQERYQMIIEQTESVVFEWDVQIDMITFSELWKRKFGYECEYHNFLMITETYFSKNENSFIPLMDQLIKGKDHGTCECQLQKANGEYIWCKITARTITDSDGYLMTIFGSIEDIDDAKTKSVQLEEQSKLDGMTQILNKTTAETMMEEVLLSASDKKHILFIIDVDDFKQINDSLGHAAGDEVLCSISASIKECFRDDDLVGRVGGDEFAVFMKDVGFIHSHMLDDKVTLLNKSLTRIRIKDYPSFKVTCSVGIASYPDSATTYQDLFKSADKALYEIKKSGKNNYVYRTK